MRKIGLSIASLTLVVGLTGLVACQRGEAPTSNSASTSKTTEKLQGTVKIDGSSTVFPISEAVAEEFQAVHPQVRVTVGVSGTGGGFKKFSLGETDISNASRPIESIEEEATLKHGVEFVEIPVAYDGISILVNPTNKFVDYLTITELKKIWEPGSKVKNWQDIRAEWPAEEIHLYGPGTDSGTFDYFTAAVVGTERASRPDYSASEDDNVIIQGISGDTNSLGYIGFAYYVENKDRLKLVPVTRDEKPIAATLETIADGSYPLSRPVFIYVSTKAAKRPEVEAFVNFYIENATKLVTEVGYVPLPDNVYSLVNTHFKDRKTGSFIKTAETGESLRALFSK